MVVVGDERKWCKKLEELVEYYNEHKCLPPYNINIGKWCSVQRYRHRKGLLGSVRVAQLNALYFWKWYIYRHYDVDGALKSNNIYSRLNDAHARKWMRSYNGLCGFYQKHKRIPKYKECAYSEWLINQRNLMKCNVLEQWKVDLLNKLPCNQ
ncbi:MAG: helicase associated domain-containing protein [Paraclostridium sp.]